MGTLASIAHPPRRAGKPHLSFTEWKQKLYQTARIDGTLPMVREVSDNILVLFWADGVEPSVISIKCFAEGVASEKKQA